MYRPTKVELRCSRISLSLPVFNLHLNGALTCIHRCHHCTCLSSRYYEKAFFKQGKEKLIA